MKNKLSIIFLLIPILFVGYMFVSNLIISLTADEVKFKTIAYDPYDIIRGKYLNVQLDINDKIIIPEILGPASDTANLERKIMEVYKALSDEEKENFKYDFEYLRTLIKLYESNDTDYYLYRDNSMYKDAWERIKTYDDSLEEDYQVEKIINKINICEKQGFDYFDLITETNFELMDQNKVREYYNKLDKKNLYVYYEIDENGYAQPSNISYTKEKDNSNYIIADSYTQSWEPQCVYTTQVNGTSLQYFIDERLASKAEDTINDSRLEGKEVVAVCKNMKGNLQIKQILVDGVDLLELLKK